MITLTLQRGEYTLTTDKSRMNLAVIHDFLSNHSYWARNIPLERVKASVEGSLCFGIFYGEAQVGFGRVITDYSTVGYLSDVFVLESHRGQGLSKWLVETIVGLPELQGFRRWMLATVDAHELYRQFGWQALSKPEIWMERYTPDVYLRNT